MKAIFIVYDEARGDEAVEILEKYGQRGFTRWEDISGRGSADGIPHFGNHAWPAMNHAILTFVEDSIVSGILEDIKAKSEESKDLGLRAFVWQLSDIF
ncbi:MAG: hypothetical protein MJY80_03180 [Bacteroidales bacterium]|nr:hypothetical protein [Bacteroidales bacterium]